MGELAVSRRRVLAGPAPAVLEASLPALVSSSARRWPERVALLDDAGPAAPRRLTYRQLSTRARAVADRLQALGMGRGDVVALAMRRGADLVAAELGVMAAGGTYMPLDSADPPERRNRVLQQSGAVALLSDQSWSASGDYTPGGVVVHALDESWFGSTGPGAPGIEAGDPDRAPQLDDHAYLLHTSGSSGQPKGVRISHRAMVNLLTWHRAARPDTELAPSAQLCAVSFDFSVHETFAPLACGGSLVILDDQCRTDAARLLDQVARHGVERLFLPVPLLELLADTARERHELPQLRHVVTTGEQLRLTPAVRDLMARTGARLHNHYGATEFQDATVFTLPPDPGGWPAVAPIGRPLPGVSIALLDDQGVPMELVEGATGELCVGGVGVADGYDRAPELSAERFCALEGHLGHWYRTGDLARIDGAGQIEHHGRRDDQLKVSGVRVEPAEVEAAVLAHPDVVGAAAVLRSLGMPRLVVHVVLGPGVGALPLDLAEVVAQRLPRALRPFGYVLEDAIPLTASGKTDRRALRSDAPVLAPPQATPGERPRNAMELQLAGLWAEVLGRDVAELDVTATFADLGGSSADLLEVARRSASVLGTVLSVRELVASPTVRALSVHLDSRAPRRARVETTSPGRSTAPVPVAVVGMAVRFPGAPDLATFWRNLVEGVDSVDDLTEDQLDGQDPELRRNPDFVSKAATLADADCFDPAYFGLSPREAALMDPQHRVFLQCAVDAFEDAGEVPDGSRTGVYAASSLSTYLLNVVLPGLGYGPGRPFTEADSQQLLVRLGNDRNYLPTRVSFQLDLRGPSMAVQSACSSSLVAVHVARRALLADECDLALAGGVSIIEPQRGGYVWEDAMIRSRDGRSRAFSADASGTLFASGCGVVLLKRLGDAVRDGNRVYAVLTGSAVNNDGRDKLGFTAPHEERQYEVVARAMAEAGVDPSQIGYVEAHGTGTALGDPIELGGLDRAISSLTTKEVAPGQILLGSVKTNIGHLDEAAGVAGLVKSVLAVHHGVIPASLHFASANPAIDFEQSAFRVATTTVPWPQDRPRTAGVSSHGMGGTNAHVVLTAPPALAEIRHPVATDYAADDAAADLDTVLPVSARSAEAALELSRRYAVLLRRPEDGSGAGRLPQVAQAAARGRRTHPWRVCVVAAERDQAARALDAATPARGRPGGLAWAFGGQGAQQVGMAHAAYERWTDVRDVVDHSADVVRSLTGTDLREIMFRGAADLNRTRWAQPALVVSGLALARLWQSWGVTPDAVLGHSVGEIAAATVAGVLDPDDALRLVVARAGLMDDLPDGGAMLSVSAGLDRALDVLSSAGLEDLDVAAINHPGSVVLSGPAESIDRAAQALATAGVASKRLRVSHAFHSALMEPILPAWAEILADVTFRAASIPLVTNVTGHSQVMMDARYWQRHVREPVRFAASVDHLVADLGITTIIEMAARPVLGALLQRDGVEVLTTSEPGRDVRRNLESLAALYTLGHDVDWAGVHPGPRRHVDLPSYPWRRDRHRLAVAAPDAAAAPTSVADERGAAQRARFLGARLEQPGSHEVRFVTQVSPGDPSWLTDHRIFAEVVMPGVALQDLALAAAVETGAPPVLHDVEVNRAMVFHDRAPRLVHVVVSGSQDGVARARVEVHSRPAAGGEWQRHLTCRTAAASEPQPSEDVLVPLSLLRTEMTRLGDVDDIYRGESARGIDLGPAFRVTEKLWTAEGRCLSEIRLPPATAAAAYRHVAHPVLLEACLLALTVTYPGAVAERSFVPVGVDRVRVVRPLRSEQAWCHARLRPERDGGDDTLVGDIELLDPDGGLLAAWDGVLLRTASARTMVTQDRWDRWTHVSCWEPSRPPAPPARAPLRWLVAAPYDDGLVGAAGDFGAMSRGVALTDLASLDPTAGDEPVDLVVVRADLLEGELEPSLAVTQLLRQRLAWVAPAKVVVVTAGAQLVERGREVRAGQGAVWGVVRAVVAEHPDLPLRAVDTAGTSFADLVRELMVEDDEEVALVGSRRLVHRLRPWRPPDPRPAAVRAGTHVVTGGWGGIGLELVDRLVATGCHEIALVGHRPPGPVASARIEIWRSGGTHVRVVVADIETLTDPVQVVALLDQLEETLSPIVAVHHLAGTLADALLTDQTPQQFLRAWKAKAATASALDRATRGRNLDAFVLYSSSSGLLGTPGQAGYAAASAFLDATAAGRACAGLPGVSIQWGSWAEVGMSARLGLDEQMHAVGEGTIPVQQGLDAHLALAAVQGVVAVLPHRWSAIAEGSRPVPASARGLLRAAARVEPQPAEAGPNLAERLRAAPVHRRKVMLGDVVHDHFASVLGLSHVEHDVGFFNLGGDSLSSLELRRRLNAALERRFAQSLVFDYPTVQALVAHIAAELDVDLGAGASGANVDDGAEPAELPLEVVEAMLVAKLAGGGSAHDRRP